jgi:hypothetical protein
MHHKVLNVEFVAAVHADAVLDVVLIHVVAAAAVVVVIHAVA